MLNTLLLPSEFLIAFTVLAPINADPGFIIECDSCFSNLTNSVRIRCADPACEGSSIDICADCFRQGKEFGRHKAGHKYRVIEKHYTPILDEGWTGDEWVLIHNSGRRLMTITITLQGSHVA